MSAKHAIYFEPENGWHAFNNSAEILDAIWKNLSEYNGEWKYMNPMTNLSIWEHQSDGSYIWIDLEAGSSETIKQLYATQGYASDYLRQCLTNFHIKENWK